MVLSGCSNKMPEGHTIHRAARDHRKALIGHRIIVSSPQGRFSDGANILDMQVCSSIEAFGKHLFYKFTDDMYLHIHLGLFGRIRKTKAPAMAPRGQVRVRLVGGDCCVDISGPTICAVRNHDEFNRLILRIGPDLLRDDADPYYFFKRVKRSRARIGTLLMDQSVVAGIGNIYRTEILWRQNIHPCTLGKDLSEAQLKKLWDDAKVLLHMGMQKNRIVTTTMDVKGRTAERLNIYNKTHCPHCCENIEIIEINGRSAFFCPNCQPIG